MKADFTISKVFNYDGYSIQYCGGSWLLYGTDGNHIRDFDSFPNVLEYIAEHPSEQEDRK